MTDVRTEPLTRYGGFVAPHPAKLLLMSVASLGLYQMYWLYENWRAMDQAKYKHVIPWLRTLFYPLFTYSNFQWIETRAAEDGIGAALKPGILFLLFFGLTFISLDPWDLSSLLNCLPLLYVNSLIIQSRKKTDPTYRPETEFKSADYSVITLGIVLYLSLWFAKRSVSGLMSSDLSGLVTLSPQEHDLLSLLLRF